MSVDRSLESLYRLFAKVEEIHKNNPDLRLGQILCNVVDGHILYNIENDKLLQCLEKFYNV